MFKRRLFDVLIGLIFLGLLGMFLYDRFIKPPKVTASSKSSFTKANDILKRKSTIPPAVLNITATSSACTLFLKNSAEISMNDYANEFIDHHVDGIVKTCEGAFPTLLQQRIDKALIECKSATRDAISKQCYGALIEAKTASVAAIIKADADPKSLDASILVHLIADKFVTGELLENPFKSLELVDALLEKEPGYLGGYKVKLLLLSMSSLNKEEHYNNLFNDTLEEATRLKSDDPDVREIALAHKGEIFKQSNGNGDGPKKDRSEFIEYLDVESSKHPNEWIYDYYKATAVYDGGRGNYEQTVALVEKALKKAPNDLRLKQTLENLNSDDEEKRRHPFVIAIGFSLDDL